MNRETIYYQPRIKKITNDKQYHRYLNILDEAVEQDAPDELIKKLNAMIKEYEKENPDVE